MILVGGGRLQVPAAQRVGVLPRAGAAVEAADAGEEEWFLGPGRRGPRVPARVVDSASGHDARRASRRPQRARAASRAMARRRAGVSRSIRASESATACGFFLAAWEGRMLRSYRKHGRGRKGGMFRLAYATASMLYRCADERKRR